MSEAPGLCIDCPINSLTVCEHSEPDPARPHVIMPSESCVFVRMDKANAEIERLREAAKAYQELATCYRISKRPSEKLFERLESARATLAEGGDNV